MMSAPPVPPRPVILNDVYDPYPRNNSSPPPVPPLPPDLRIQDHISPPHYADPLAAPRPQKLDPGLPANMARDLDDQANSYAEYSRQQLPVNYTPGFAMPPSHPPAPPAPPVPPAPPPWQSNWNQSYPVTYAHSPPYSPPQSYPRPPQSYQPPPDITPSMNSLSLNPQQRAPSVVSSYAPRPEPQPSPKSPSAVPALTAPLPTIASLSASLPSIQLPNCDPAVKVAWCRDVIFLVNRLQQSDPSTDPPVGPVRIFDPQLLRLSQVAVPMIIQISSIQPLPSPTPPYLAEAIFHRGTFAASGAYPDQVRHSPRAAFKDFEAARGGYPAAWFRLGRDYETFNDNNRARNCFERGMKFGVESCAYRMGMAHLMGQLGLPTNHELAIPMLHRAATLATVEVPQPAYVFGLLLLAEFSHVTVLPHLFAPIIPPGSTPSQEARKHLERAAYLNFAPAQYKLGHAYEFAQLPFPFDPLLSVQYYSLASQQGEADADMALSKWFLCGAEGAFDKDENLACTFAEKAAKKALPSAEFAMGYYAEVGVGGPIDIDAARRWYQRASEHGNTDAADRLSALSQPTPKSLSRQEHDSITETKLMRKHTQAKQRSSQPGPSPARGDSRMIVDGIRNNSLAMPGQQTSPLLGPQGSPPGQSRLPAVAEYTGPPAQPAQAPPAQAPPTQTPPAQWPPMADTSPNASARLQPAQPGGRPAPHRYTLSDPGSLNTPGASPQPGRATSPAQKYPGRAQSPGGRPGALGRLDGTPPQDEPFTPPGPGRKPGPSTFAEMGIQGGKAEEKECVIM